jgi:MFS family permease
VPTGAAIRRLQHAHAAETRARASHAPQLVVWGAWLVLMTGANLATPLYAVYAQKFGFSTLVLTTVFATYAAVLVPALVLFGGLSDRLGRRVVILGGLGVAAGALLLFTFANGPAWLYGARAVQGLAVGMISGAATAALVELDPRGDRRQAALLAGLAQTGGSAAGPVLAGMLARFAPAPLRLSFAVGLCATAAAAAAVLTVPEPRDRPRQQWRIEWPRVPPRIRRPFLRVSLTAATVWAAVALYLSVVPSYAGALLQTHNLALLAAIAAIALVSSFATQLVSRRLHTSVRSDQVIGLVALAAGLLVLVAASPLHSLALLVVGAVTTGAGHGIAFLNAQQELNDIAPEERRGEVTAAFIACIYFLVASAVIATGLLDLRFSLPLSVGVVSVALSAVAVATAVFSAARSATAASTSL